MDNKYYASRYTGGAKGKQWFVFDRESGKSVWNGATKAEAHKLVDKLNKEVK
jgi:hypothetical protein